MKNLVIVESPAKSKIIEKYLGKDYKVLSSMGHIRDLSTKGKFGFGIDVNNDFKPDYIAIKGKKKTIDEFKKQLKSTEHVFLASDPDREGEAISWHIKDTLELSDDKYSRIVFNEITKKAVLESLNNARKIDDDMVKSQETRRMLDRIIGFRLSKLMQSKIGSKSAGRVQSVALKLIVDKEKEIADFIIEEYYTITSVFDGFEADLFKYKEDKIEIKTLEHAKDIINSLSNAFRIEEIKKTKENKKSKPAYKTSTLQQDAANKLNFNPKKTMMLAQKLYEGIDIGSETTGLITYMRTDSLRLSDDFVYGTQKHIEENYGKEYVGYIKVNKSNKNIQDAHEAIRPTNINNVPEKIKEYLSNDEYKLYRMIYYRTLASLMSDAKLQVTSIILDNNDYKFKASGQILTFDGYLKVYSEYEQSKDTVLPPIDEYKTDVIVSISTDYKKHFTKPPARFNDASLINELEKLGIGRPSTYSTIITTLKDRGYVELFEKRFKPTELGTDTSEALQKQFSNIINVEYTAKMEDDLDKIASGEIIWLETLTDFYQVFSKTVEDAFENMEKKEAKKTGDDCPLCNNPLVIKRSKYGEFIACSNYPECKYIKQEDEKNEICDCPNCDGKIIAKKSKKGKIFYGCNNYPKCSTAYWDKPTGKLCKECSSMLVEKNGKIKCSACSYIEE